MRKTFDSLFVNFYNLHFFKNVSYVKCDIIRVLKTSWIYPTIFFSVIIIYYECVFFSGYYLQFIGYPSHEFAGLAAVFRALFSINTILDILLTYFIVSLIFWIFRHRNSITIEKFIEDDQADQEQNDLSGPLHQILSDKLSHISKIYSDIDTRRAISTTLNVVSSPSIIVTGDNITDFVKTMDISESKLKLGLIEIPLNIIFSFFGKLLMGKKIQGNLLVSQSEIVIIASMSGGKKAHSWKVIRNYSSSSDSSEPGTAQKNNDEDKGVLIRLMIEELAFKIFSDLTEFQSYNWEATYKFFKGIETYRRSLLSPKDRIPNLKEAEKLFSEALSLDTTFSMAWYYIGVVYSELNFLDAANVAFFKSFTHKRIKGNAYYASALNIYRTYIEDPAYGVTYDKKKIQQSINNLNDGVFFCKHAKSLQKGNPDILLLLGRLELELYYLAESPFPLKRCDISRRTHIKNAIYAFSESVKISYQTWWEEEYKIQGDHLFPLIKGTLTENQLKHRERLRERLGELGWAYLEYAALEQDTVAKLSNFKKAVSVLVIEIKKPDNLQEKLIASFDLLSCALDAKYLDNWDFFNLLQKYAQLDPDSLEKEKNKIKTELLNEFTHINIIVDKKIQTCRSNKEKFLTISKQTYFEALFKNPYIDEETITNDFINQDLHRDVADPLLFWKCGIVLICLEKIKIANLFLNKALVINPKAFLFQASHLLGSLLQGNKIDEKILSHFYAHVLKKAYVAYKNDKDNNDYQWGYLAEAVTLIGILRFHHLNITLLPEIRNECEKYLNPDEKEWNCPFRFYYSNSLFRYEGEGSTLPIVDKKPDLNRFTPLMRMYSANTTRDDRCYNSFSMCIQFFYKVFELVKLTDSLSVEEFTSQKTQVIHHEICESVFDKILQGMQKQPCEKPVKSGKNSVYENNWAYYHKNWILAMIAYLIGVKIFELGINRDEACSYFVLANNYLKDKYELEIGHKGINALVSNTLKDSLKNREAISFAWKAHWIDPTSYYEHENLGECESNIGDHQNAIRSWSEGLLFKPDMLEIYLDIAISNIELSKDYPFDPDNPDSCQQTIYLDNAMDYLKKALLIAEYKFQSDVSKKIEITEDDVKEYKSENLDKLIVIHFWMGRVHVYRGEFSEALNRFRVVKNMAGPSPEEPEKCPPSDAWIIGIPATYYLGLCLYKLDRFIEAKQELTGILPDMKCNDVTEFKKLKDYLNICERRKKHLHIEPLIKIIGDILLLVLRIEVLHPDLDSDIQFSEENIKNQLKILCEENKSGFAPTQINKNYIEAEIKKISGLKILEIDLIERIHLSYPEINEYSVNKKLNRAKGYFVESLNLSYDPETLVLLMVSFYRCISYATNQQNGKEIIGGLDYYYQAANKAGLPREYLSIYKNVQTCLLKYQEKGKLDG